MELWLRFHVISDTEWCSRMFSIPPHRAGAQMELGLRFRVMSDAEWCSRVLRIVQEHRWNFGFDFT
eukprot:162557-Rhodomonas_salina.1